MTHLPQRSRNARWTWRATLCALGVAGTAYASEPTMLSRVQSLELSVLEGEVTVHFSDGYATRARRSQELGEAASRYFRQPEVLNISFDLTLAVLDRDDWESIGGHPYGVPYISDVPNQPKVAFLPAGEDSPVSSLIVGLRERLSEATLERCENLGMSFDDAARRFVDLIELHEIGHAYAAAYMTEFEESWLNEFLATYLAYAFMKERRPQMAQLWEVMNDALVEAAEHKHTSLADFDRLYTGVGLSNYGWYQGKFQQQSAAVFRESGLSFIHALKAAWLETLSSPADDPLRLRQLQKTHPGFATWAEGPVGNLD